MINEKRSHHCGVLTKEQAGEQVVLCGWVAKRRDHGGLIFIDLRDRSGIVQVVADPESAGSSFKTAEDIRNEYVIKVIGNVRLRDEATINENIPTGTIEVLAHDIEVLNGAKTPPFYIKDGIDTDENLRLKYRYLDLRRPEMQRNLILRHKVAKLMRDYLDDNHFLEIETPMLCKSTPEGARDYLVPSRVNPGKFYALPQSPQIFKQLLMVAGMERYFQIARCFRDEDLRADRQPEYTKLDMEMSVMEVDEILELMEGLIHHIFKGALGKDIQIPFQRLTGDDAMERFGSDFEIKWGVGIDSELGKKVKVTILATGFGIENVDGMNKHLKKHTQEEVDRLAREEDNKIALANRRDRYYGRDGGNMQNKRRPHIFLFSPESLDNEDIILAVENTPTYKRTRQKLDEIRQLLVAKTPVRDEKDSGEPIQGLISFT